MPSKRRGSRRGPYSRCSGQRTSSIADPSSAEPEDYPEWSYSPEASLVPTPAQRGWRAEDVETFANVTGLGRAQSSLLMAEASRRGLEVDAAISEYLVEQAGPNVQDI